MNKKIWDNIFAFLRGSYIIFSSIIISKVISSKIENEPLEINFRWFFCAKVIIGGFVVPHLDKPRKESLPNTDSKVESEASISKIKGNG